MCPGDLPQFATGQIHQARFGIRIAFPSRHRDLPRVFFLVFWLLAPRSIP
jgi:hypothetical protein